MNGFQHHDIAKKKKGNNPIGKQAFWCQRELFFLEAEKQRGRGCGKGSIKALIERVNYREEGAKGCNKRTLFWN